MLLGIDHLVVAVADLDTAVASYRALGFTVVPGGRHPVGTHNALIAFADAAYLELIAFYEPSPAHRWWPPLQAGGGLVDFCLRTDDLAGDTAALRRAGVAIDDPAPLSRVRPDGFRLRWRLSVPRGGHRGVAPFLIEDETPREERVPGQVRHANGVTGIARLTVAVDRTGTAGGWLAGVLGQAGRDVRREELDAAGIGFTLGVHELEFVWPRGPRSPLAAWIAARGSAPYMATLRGPTGTPRALDEARTLGARLVLA